MRRHDRLAFALALCAMLLRALLPAGFMPAVDASGNPTLVLCTSQGEQIVSIDALKKSTAHTTHGEQCPFGFALSMAGGVAVAPASMPVAINAELPLATARVVAQTGSPKAHLARGPPSALA